MQVFRFWSDKKESLKESSSVALLSPTCFPLFHFVFLFFYSITLIHFIFVLCWRLQCWHSCRYFDLILIYFLFHFPLLHFSFLILFSVTSFYISIVIFNNFILFYLCAVLKTAMLTLMPIFCFNFNFILISYSGTSFYISIFYSVTFFNSMFVLCRGLQCLHSCQYFI